MLNGRARSFWRGGRVVYCAGLATCMPARRAKRGRVWSASGRPAREKPIRDEILCLRASEQRQWLTLHRQFCCTGRAPSLPPRWSRPVHKVRSPLDSRPFGRFPGSTNRRKTGTIFKVWLRQALAPAPFKFGGVVEWSIAPVLKTGEPKGSVGSNPTPSDLCEADQKISLG